MVDLNDFLPDDRILLTTFLSFCFGFLLKTSDQTSYDFGIAEFIDVEFFDFIAPRVQHTNEKTDEDFIPTDQNRFVFSSSFENEFGFFRLYDNFQSFE